MDAAAGQKNGPRSWETTIMKTRLYPAAASSTLFPAAPDYVEVLTPAQRENLVYSPSASDAVTTIANRLSSLSLPARAILFGEPGIGKSATLRNLAVGSLRPFWSVKSDQLFSAFLGGTASNLSNLFVAAGKANAVLVFDDFDAIARRRDDPRESGESRRVVTTLLSAMDETRSSTAVLAATNLPDVIDPAVVRRFEFLVPFGRLDRTRIKELLQLVLNQEVVAKSILSAAEGFSPAEIVEMAATLRLRNGALADLEVMLKQRKDAIQRMRGRS
jgi:SpoVK/Ycf46/Vps4 family AAA+-type ATPase